MNAKCLQVIERVRFAVTLRYCVMDVKPYIILR